jgi:hypothetical protein
MKFAPKRTLFVLFVLFVSSCEPNLLCVPARNHLHHLGVAPEESRTKTQRHKAEGVFGKAALAVWPLCVLCLCARNPCPSLHEPNRHKFIPAGERGLTPGKQKRGRDTVGARVPEPNRLGLRKSLRTAGEDSFVSPTRPCGAKRRRGGLASLPSCSGIYPEI